MARRLKLSGYIVGEKWWDDEFDPATLHDMLYGEDGLSNDDVQIILSSYGGSCDAAVRMHDDIVAYPGKVTITISGTAASHVPIALASPVHVLKLRIAFFGYHIMHGEDTDAFMPH